MSGTSADGVDGAIVRLSLAPTLADARAAFHRYVPFTPEQRAAIFSLFDAQRADLEEICRLNFQLGEWFAAAALETIDAAGLRPAAVDLIGSHGQTVWHCPPSGRPGDVACTLQIGEPAVIAERTGITTVADFRVRDVAAGGHGAPLVSYVDDLLFRDAQATRIVLNLGGIANVTVLYPHGDRRPPIAFDTGPGNMVLDWLAAHLTGGAQSCDVDGLLAAAGAPDALLLAELLADPYFAAPPPKTTGREQFGAPYARRLFQRAGDLGLSPEDTMATALALTVQTVAGAIRLLAHGPLEVIAGGGGTKNPALMAALRRLLPEARIATHEDFGIPSQAKEALSFAILAAQAIRGLPNTLPSCTGASHAVVMGKILPGANYTSLLRRLFSSAE